MATITIQITAGGQTVGRVKTVSGPDLTRFITAYRSSFLPADKTDEEVAQAWADAMLDQAKRIVKDYEARQLVEIVLT